MKYTIKRGDTKIAVVRPEGQVSTKIMAEETVSMEFELPKRITFLTNDSVEVYGNTYYLGNEPVVNRINNRKYHYTLQFVSVKYELSKVQCFYPNNQNHLTVSEWSAIADASKLIDLVVQNANRVQSGWSVGTVTSTESKQVDFNGDNCLSVLAKIAEAFKLEYWVDNDKSIHFEECKQISGYSFQYGMQKGLKEITRTPLDNSNIVTRLYAFGGEKNLPTNYRNFSKKLRMPVPYLEKNTNKYGIIEHTKTFGDIYPKRVGKVTVVSENNPLLFTDDTLDFDLNEIDAKGTTILINKVSAKVNLIAVS